MAEEENNNSFFGKFDNKYVRGGVAALIAAYAAKEDPYLLQGFAEGIEEKQKADRETRNAIIKSATDAKMRFKAEDLKRRKKRRADVEPKIKQAKELGINAVVAGKAFESGELDTLIKFRVANPTYDINSVYEISDQFKDKISGMTHSQIIESLVGKSQKFNELADNIQAPKRTNFLRNFIEGTDRDTDIVSDVKTRFAAMDVEKDESDIVDFDTSQVKRTEKGKDLIAKFLRKDETTESSLKRELAAWTSTTMKIKAATLDNYGNPVFSRDTANNNNYAQRITSKLLSEVTMLVRDPNSPAFNDRKLASEIVKRRYEIRTEEGPTELNIQKLNEGEETPIIPEGWTRAKTTKSEIEKAERKEGGGDGKKVTTSGNKTIDDIVKKWNGDKLDRYEAYGKNKNNSQYKRFVRIQGKAKQKEIKDLGGDPNLISLEY